MKKILFVLLLFSHVAFSDTPGKEGVKRDVTAAGQWEIGIVSHESCDRLFRKVNSVLRRYIDESAVIVSRGQKNKVQDILDTLAGLSIVYRNLCLDAHAEDTQ